MHIEVDCDYMEGIAGQLYQLCESLAMIETTYNHVASEIQSCHIREDINSDLRETGVYLQHIKTRAKQYSQVFLEAQQAYTQSDLAVNRLYQNLQLHDTDTKSGNREACNNNNHNISEHIERRMRSYPCPLPDKMLFEQATIYPKLIDKGNNILVRSWKRENKKK